MGPKYRVLLLNINLLKAELRATTAELSEAQTRFEEFRKIATLAMIVCPKE